MVVREAARAVTGQPSSDDSDLIASGSLQRGGDGELHLLGGACRDCGLMMFPRVAVCPGCMGENIAEEVMPDEGTLYSSTLVHVGPARWKKPFAVGYVDLPNGVRVFAHLKGDVAIGGRVVLSTDTVGATPDGHDLRNFVFAAEGTAS